MIYADWTTALAGYLPEQLVNAAAAAPFIATSRYNQVLTRCIEYAELRIYREPELDFLATRFSGYIPCQTGVRLMTIPAGTIIVEEVNVITPAGQGAGSAGSMRNSLEPASVAFMNRAWPAVAFQALPEHFARFNDTQIILGPAPDQSYEIEFYGIQRPAALSNTNTSTVLTANFPDLFLAASMIFMSGYQKTFGAMSGDPQQGLTWETYYAELKHGAASEEARKKFQSSDWSAMVAATEATPPRA